VQLPFVPGVGIGNVPYSLPIPPLPVGVPGPAAHDGRGYACTFTVLDQLMRGLEPDQGLPASLDVVDGTTGQVIHVPPSVPPLP
jgi:hypothetical protein